MNLTNIEATSLPHLKDFGVLLGLVSLQKAIKSRTKAIRRQPEKCEHAEFYLKELVENTLLICFNKSEVTNYRKFDPSKRFNLPNVQENIPNADRYYAQLACTPSIILFMPKKKKWYLIVLISQSSQLLPFRAT